MTRFIEDDLDFSAYEQATEFKVKVRAASLFADDLDEAFTPRTAPAKAVMSSTKLRTAIEFRPGEVTTWAGYNGHRKSMLTGQVVLDLIAASERTMVMSLEMPPRDTLQRMVMQACAIDRPDKQRRAEFMRWTDGKLWFFDFVGALSPLKCMAVCRYFSAELAGQHVFIDSFMKVCDSEERMDAQKAMVGQLCDLAKETGLHIHLVAHCRKPASGDENRPPTKYEIKGSGAISDQSHNVILIWENKAKRAELDKERPDPEALARAGKFDALVCIDKQRNGRIEGKFGLYFDHRTLRFCDSDIAAVEPYPMEQA